MAAGHSFMETVRLQILLFSSHSKSCDLQSCNKFVTPPPLAFPSRSPHYGAKVMSVGSLLEEGGAQAVVWRGPRKTALIKRFMKDTFWGRMDYLIFDILIKQYSPRDTGDTEF